MKRFSSSMDHTPKEIEVIWSPHSRVNKSQKTSEWSLKNCIFVYSERTSTLTNIWENSSFFGIIATLPTSIATTSKSTFSLHIFKPSPLPSQKNRNSSKTRSISIIRSSRASMQGKHVSALSRNCWQIWRRKMCINIFTYPKKESSMKGERTSGKNIEPRDINWNFTNKHHRERWVRLNSNYFLIASIISLSSLFMYWSLSSNGRSI